MLSRCAVTAFLSSANARRTKAFYGKALGLRLVAEDAFALVYALKGAPLRIQKVEQVSPQPFTALGWQVTSIRRTVRALVRRRVNFERYAFLEQDDDAIWTAPGGTQVAWFRDPDGHILSLSQSP
jgi:catechol 2,3-dioxygenase-like lactoylglutathione lyase family enzyme